MQTYTIMAKWIVVSDASRARIFEADARGMRLGLVGGLEHPGSRAKVRDLMADANGRKPAGASVATRPGPKGRPGAAPETDPKWVEAQKFARQLNQRLEAGLHEGAYDSLVVAAPPQFLGLLRQVLSAQVQARIELWMDKDLTHHPVPEIQAGVAAELSA